MKLYRYIFLLSLIVFSVPLCGQESLPYRCDFSSESELLQWVPNVGNTSRFLNKWYVGSFPSDTVHNEYIYISGDVGVTASYAEKDNMVVSYRAFDMAAGVYDLAFDWRGMGRDSSAACMYVVWCPETFCDKDLPTAVSPMASFNFYTGEHDFPLWMTDYMLKNIDGDSAYYGRVDWTHSVVRLECPTAERYRLAFVWVNKRSDVRNQPAACVDNIEIVEASCERPSDFKALGSFVSVDFSWNGTADEYELMYSPVGKNDWTLHKVQRNELNLQGIKWGVYEVRLRSICGSDTSVWMHYPLTFIYEAQCLDYLSLDSAVCTWGNTGNPERNVEKLDLGYKSRYSSHTIHYDTTEMDPRTDGALRTVPRGEIASVRLGNWQNGSLAESVTYDYYVDADYASILLLNYAVVLQDPNHNQRQQPRFELEILDSAGNPVDEMCGTLDFKASSDLGIEWKQTLGEDDIVVMWKDWTTIGLNLTPYNGQTIKIKLTTRDCAQGGHYGYAYFTVGCAKGEIQGMGCGDNPTERFEAPEGFDYRWYKTDDPEQKTIGKDRFLDIEPDDRDSYTVECIYPTVEGCSFTLEASAAPRSPESGMEMRFVPRDCQNLVEFTDTSCIVDDEGAIIEGSVDSVRWNLGPAGTSVQRIFTHLFPDEGFEYDSCCLVSYMGGGSCTDTLYFKLDISPIDGIINEIPYNLCIGDTLFAEGDTIVSGGSYDYAYPYDATGCDSVVRYNVTEVPAYPAVFDTVQIADGNSYTFGFEELDTAGDYTHRFETAFGCDSVVHLHLEVLSLLKVEFPSIAEICHKDTSIVLPYIVNEGTPQSIKVEFDEHAHTAGGFVDIERQYTAGEDFLNISMPENILPDKYSVRVSFSDGLIGRDTVDLILDVRYSAEEVIAQRWDDVLGIRKCDYSFISYQWVKDGTPIPGEISPNFYEEEGLELSSEYAALLTRSTDGVSQFTCVYTPLDYREIDDFPTVFFPGATVEISIPQNSVAFSEPVTVKVWSPDGRLYSQITDIGQSYSVALPYTPGVYVIQIIASNYNELRKIVVK